MHDPRAAAENLSDAFRDTFGDDLRSVVLFGSVARGEAIPGTSDVNVLILLEQVTPVQLDRAAPLARAWVLAGNTPPMMVAADEWPRMHDTFAIEISDMIDAREVIHGEDPLEAPSLLDPSELRLHAEREIRQTLLQLRLRMLLTVGDPLELGNLLLSGIPSFGSYMRACLRLEGRAAPLDTESTMLAAASLIDADPEAMLTCQAARRERRVMADLSITDPLVEAYTDFAHRLADFLDRVPVANAFPRPFEERTLAEEPR